MNSCELVTFVTAAACAIANCAPEDDIPVIAAVLGQIAATLATISVSEAKNKPKEVVPIEPDTDILVGAEPNIILE